MESKFELKTTSKKINQWEYERKKFGLEWKVWLGIYLKEKFLRILAIF